MPFAKPSYHFFSELLDDGRVVIRMSAEGRLAPPLSAINDGGGEPPMIRILVDHVVAAYHNAAMKAISTSYLHWDAQHPDRLLGANALGIVLIDKIGGIEVRHRCDDGQSIEMLVVDELGITSYYRRGFYRAFLGQPIDPVYRDKFVDYAQGWKDGYAAREAVIERDLIHNHWR